MRGPHLLTLSFLLPIIHAVSLTDFQPIDGFSDKCTSAYKTPLTGCKASDFQGGDCSTDCISFLEALTKIINTQCKGTTAFPNTLIGLFFSQQGTKTLCPNVLGTSGGGDPATYSQEAQPSRSDREENAKSTTSSAAETSSTEEAASTTTSSSSSEESSSSSSKADSSTSSSASASSSSSPPPSSSPSPTPSPAANAPSSSSTTSSSSKAPKSSSSSSSSTSNSNAESGGDGTILGAGAGSSAPPNRRLVPGLWAWVGAGGVSLVWLRVMI